MKPTKFRWSRVYESAEEELQHYLTAHKLQAERWEAPEFHEFTDYAFEQETIIFCAEGSLSFDMDGNTYALQPGDALRIPAHTGFVAQAGFSGCVCYESSINK